MMLIPPNVGLALALGLPLLGSPVLALLGRRLGARVGWVALLLPLASTGALLAVALSVQAAGPMVIEWPWIPSLGLGLSFRVDGFSLFFGLVASGVGCLVFFYAVQYLDRGFRHAGRFYCYLALFMAAMLGTVFANNLVLLFVFWELTGLASFLLIGFQHHDSDSRRGARQALLVTAGTGLALLAGIIMVGTAAGTYDYTELVARGLPWSEQGGWLSAALGLMLLGAFGKSAQFPFHFWLPNAMAAPTPVSAYLHSATMVKLGVFLCGRLLPLFGSSELWTPLVAIIPFTTMVVAAVLALLSHDLKAILAFSTVSQLGYLIGYYGLAPEGGVAYDYLHILNHVLYKGSLFMIVGLVVHAVGVRDLRQLGGLGRRLPLLAGLMLLGAATMAGLPGTIGFLSKEMMLKEVLAAAAAGDGWSGYAAVCVVLASVVKVAFSVRLCVSVFFGAETDAARQAHAPPWASHLPPLLLVSTAVILGLAPGWLDQLLGGWGVAGLNQPAHLQLWHGFTRELWISAGIVLAGFALHGWGVRTHWRWHTIPPRWQIDRYFEAALDGFSRFTQRFTRWTRADRPLAYLPMVIGFTVAVVGGALLWQLVTVPALRAGLGAAEAPDLLRSFVGGLTALAVLAVVVLRRWTTQVIALSVAGFLICVYFVLHRAPDLALTQILVEVVTLLLILILLGRFPRSAEAAEATRRPGAGRRVLQIALALGMGVTMAIIVLLVTAAPSPDRLGDFVIAQTQELTGGTNAVNTILVDFRGFDTMGEIAVLLIAMLGGLGLLVRYKRTADEFRAGPVRPLEYGTDQPCDREHERP